MATVVDATLIAAPSSTKNEDKQRDPEMMQTKKGNQWYFGMKAHISEMLRSLSNDQKRFLLNQLQTWVQFLRNGTEPDQASPGNFKP